MFQNLAHILQLLLRGREQELGWGPRPPAGPSLRPSLAESHLIGEELKYEGGHAAVDADEEVDAGEHHVGRAGHGEEEGGWVHERRDRPAGGEGRQELQGDHSDRGLRRPKRNTGRPCRLLHCGPHRCELGQKELLRPPGHSIEVDLTWGHPRPPNPLPLPGTCYRVLSPSAVLGGLSKNRS